MTTEKLKKKSTKELDSMLNNKKYSNISEEIRLLLVERKTKFCIEKQITFPAFRSSGMITGTIESVKKSYNDGNFYCVIKQENGQSNTKKLDYCYELLCN